jgi:hypothetical protein
MTEIKTNQQVHALFLLKITSEIITLPAPCSLLPAKKQSELWDTESTP